MGDYPPEIENLGDVDGEVPDQAALKITGAGIVDRAMLRGERVALTVVGEVTGISFKWSKGALVRTHTVKAESVAEATGQLGEDVTQFLRDIEDARGGKTALPLEEDEDDEEGDGE